MKVLITGAAGYIGQQVAARLADDAEVIGVDVRDADVAFDLRIVDVRSPTLRELIATEAITHVVHLAAVLEDSGDRARDFDIDVNGTANVLRGCVEGGVQHVTVTSSGAAYGYHADNPVPLTEADPLRGNPAFAYADHKRQVEELLATARRDHPELGQLVLRVGTVLGATTDNLITAVFDRRVLPTVAGSAAPFVFVWDADLVAIISRGVADSRTGIFNVAGDHTVSMRDIGRILGRRIAAVPAPLLRLGLGLARTAGIGRYGPEQVDFLRYRPVLDNTALKRDFGYTPAKTSEETFRFFAAATGRAPRADLFADGRVALVTGAGGALGGALASRLAASGMSVVVTDRSAPPVPERGSAIAGDLTDPRTIDDLVDHVRDVHGHLDLLIHCAGITHRSPAASSDPDLLARVMAVNWEAPVRLTQRAVPLMRPGGTIVAVSSMAGWMPVAGRAAYGGSKAALWHYLEALRPEVEPRGIGVLCVHPSFMTSVMADASGGTRPRSSVGTAMPVDEVATLVLDAVAARRRWVFPDPASRAASLLWFVWPGLYHRLMRRRFKDEVAA